MSRGAGAFLERDLATRAAALASFPERWGSSKLASRSLCKRYEASHYQARRRSYVYGDDLLDLAVTCAIKSSR